MLTSLSIWGAVALFAAASIMPNDFHAAGGHQAMPAAVRAQQGSSTLVIAEFRTRGPGGASDEFVELFNRSRGPVDITGWELWASNDSGGISWRATMPDGVTLQPGCRYLLGRGSYYSGIVPADQSYGNPINDSGGVAVCNGPCDDPGNRIDQVGMSARSAFAEGTPLAPLSMDQDQSYERLPAGINGQDGDDNAADFQLNVSSSNPQNALSSCTPLAVTLASFEAESREDHVLVTWETASEVGNIGFNLWRSLSPAGPEDLLAFVPSLAPGSSQGFVYTYRDFAVAAGTTYFYWLEDVDTAGAVTLHGPVSAQFGTPTAVSVVAFRAVGQAESRAVPVVVIFVGIWMGLWLGSGGWRSWLLAGSVRVGVG